MAIALRFPAGTLPTAAQVAAAVRVELAVELARVDVPISSVVGGGAQSTIT